MARDIDGVIKQKYAESGDVGLGGLDLEELWPISYSTPGGPFPQRIQFNQLFRYLSALAVEINANGPFLDYDDDDPDGPDYDPGAIARGSDGILYLCQVANGPDSTIVDPVGDTTGTWVAYTPLNSAINGGVLSNASDEDHDITISACLTPDSLGAEIIQLKSAITKRIDAAWAVGTNAGGLFSGTVAADTVYGVFLIKKDSDGSIDAGFDTSATAANIPTGYTAYRRIGWVITDSSSNIIGFEAVEISGGSVRYDYLTTETDLTGVVGNTTRNLLTVTAPPGTLGIFTLVGIYGSNTSDVWLKSTSFTDIIASTADRDIALQSNAARGSVVKLLPVDSSSQVAYRSEQNDVTIQVQTNGFIDRRIS